MHYFALLISPERDLTPDEAADRDGGVPGFPCQGRLGDPRGRRIAIRRSAARITGGPDAPVVTDGPFAEGAEVAGGYYVFEAENLDEALALARDIPATK